MKQELVRITQDQLDWLKKKKRATGLSRAQIIRNALNEKMERENGHSKGVKRGEQK